MHRRFEGKEGRRRLLDALLAQHIVEHDELIAKRLLERVTLRTFASGQVLISENGADCDLFFILHGRVSIIIKGREVGLFRQAGEHVGEMALFDSSPRSATVKAVEETVVACVTEADFSAIAEKLPRLWRPLAVQLAKRLRERSKFIRQPNAKPRIFIGSSSEALKPAAEVHAGLQDPSLEVTLWKTPGVFEASYTTIENLVRQVDVSDFGVLVLGPDDTVISRKKKESSPRDNVLFELGLFMGALGRERTIILSPRWKKIKWPSDLFGVTPLLYDSPKTRGFAKSISDACVEMKKCIDKLGPK